MQLRIPALFLTTALAVLATGGSAQAPARHVTVLAGLGNSLGWLGGSVEAYLAGGRVSAFGGLGYTPGSDGEPNGPTFAAGFRGFTGGTGGGRGYLELSITQVAIESPGDPSVDGERYYGPTVMVGYQHMSRSGFTKMLGIGLGAITGDSPAIGATVPLVMNLGFGYTW